MRRTVPFLTQHGLAIEALSVTPPTMHMAIGGTLKARLAAQDTADHLRAALSLYPSAKGLVPINCLAPEAIHASEDFRYVFIAGPPFWRKELASLSLRGGKDVIVAPPRTLAEACEIAEISSLEGRLTVLYNELRFAPAVEDLRALLAAGGLGPACKLCLRLTLAPPLCCTDGHPSADERATAGGWWHSRAQGGGAMGAAGVQAFELMQHLTATPVAAVRATFAAETTADSPDRAGAPASDARVAADATAAADGGGCSGGGGEADRAYEYSEVAMRFEGGATAHATLDWRENRSESRSEMAGSECQSESTLTGVLPVMPVLTVEGRNGWARLDLCTGRLEVMSRPSKACGEAEVSTEAASAEGDMRPRVMRSGEGSDLLHEAHGALARALMQAQAEMDGEGADPDELKSSLVKGLGSGCGSIRRSFAGVAACYRSWDESRGERWCEVVDEE